MKREFVMLAHKLDYANPSKIKQHLGGWWYSEKLDGERCFWDGGETRGLLKSEVPWANCAKDARYQTPQRATGLWSRYGNVIHAPDWFLDALPRIMLDGELFALNKQKRQFTHSTIKKIYPVDSEWKDITYMVFDSPPPLTIFEEGVIDTTNFKKRLAGCASFWTLRNHSWCATVNTPFETVYTVLKSKLVGCDANIVRLHNQFVLPYPMPLALDKIKSELDKIVEWGGEGLIVRKPSACYECGRSHNLLKVKPFEDMEGTVVGYITGRSTDLGSKLLGLMGALVLRLDSGIRLELSGFTDSERTLGVTQADWDKHDAVEAINWARQNPETECPDWIEACCFPRGTRVTFKYRGLSDDGVPQEARYWRNRE